MRQNQPLRLHIARESWPIAGSFTISRGSKTTADVVVVSLEADGKVGRGECVPYARYHETLDQVVRDLEKAGPVIEAGLSFADIPNILQFKAAQNALDCALWDLQAKLSGVPCWQRAELPQPEPFITAYTLSLASPETMAEAAAKASDRPLLKLKLGAEGDNERLKFIRAAAPNSRLIVDANEGWRPEQLPAMLQLCAETGVELVEQPLPAGDDEALCHIPHSVPVCADESAHGLESLPRLLGKYDAINIKLDKTGGLTPALALATAARQANLKIMVGCMLATSLAMAPAMLLASFAEFIDLDGPLLLKADRAPGVTFTGSTMHPAPLALWG